MAQLGDIKAFQNFLMTVPAGITPEKYIAVIVWCETFVVVK